MRDPKETRQEVGIAESPGLPRERSTPGAPVAKIVPGLFFHPPLALPRGRHSLPREQIAAAQHERLMIAWTELTAAHGYAAVTVGDVVQRAQVSRAVFYSFFSDKKACALAAYDRFIEVLLGGLASARDQHLELPEFIDAALRAYLAPMQQDPVVGRTFQVEIDAMGAAARRCRRESLQLFADALGTHHRQLTANEANADPLPSSAYLGIVYAVRQLTSDAIEADNAAGLVDSVPELSRWLLRLFAH